MSPASGLYLERAIEISSSLTAGCESPLLEKAHASGYKRIHDQVGTALSLEHRIFTLHVVEIYTNLIP